MSDRMRSVDLNADLGEAFGPWPMGRDAELMAAVSSANIACGWHAGDPAVMARTVGLALDAGIALGAHPGYPDLAGFGRRSMAMGEDEVYGTTLYQVGALAAFAAARGARLSHVKPHGALYNDAATDPAKARGVARAVRDAAGLYRAAGGEGAGGAVALGPSYPFLVGLPGSELEKAAAELGLPYAREFFADRAYDDGGRLVPRGRPGAVIHDAELAVARTLRALEKGVVASVGGLEIPMRFETICLHGDAPEAVAFARRLRAALEAAGIEVRPLVKRDRGGR